MFAVVPDPREDAISSEGVAALTLQLDRRQVTGLGVRRDKAALSSGCKSHPANAPAGSSRSIHQAAVLLHASFRPRLAATSLRFANPSPPSGWVKDLHLQAVDHARHNRKRPAFKVCLIRLLRRQDRLLGERYAQFISCCLQARAGTKQRPRVTDAT
jgi:hypothetical protein